MLAILSNLEGNAVFLMRAEVPGPQKGKLVPRLKDSSRLLYLIYLSLTFAEVLALIIAGLPVYDSFINAFGTMGTGGFSVLNDSIGGYGNPTVEWIMAIFLLLAGVNYNIYFFLIVKRFRDIRKNEELRTYLIMILSAAAIITVNLYTTLREAYPSFSEALRAAFFQVTSIITTAGFTTADFSLWPNLSQSVLLILMMTGACAGSTAGGFKLSRLLITFKSIGREIRRIFKPNSVQALRLDGEILDDKTATSAINYMTLYIMIIAISSILISFDGKDVLTNLTVAISAFNNVGPALGDAFSSMRDYSYFSKAVLSISMLFGRLEIMPMLVLLAPATWKKN
jgi:trk system potassium uptake protein TrkH